MSDLGAVSAEIALSCCKVCSTVMIANCVVRDQSTTCLSEKLSCVLLFVFVVRCVSARFFQSQSYATVVARESCQMNAV
jgi:hypothetical protein